MVRELADKPDRVGQENGLPTGEGKLAGGGVQRGEELVLREDAGSRQSVEQGGLTGVGVAHDGDAGQATAVACGTHGAAVLFDNGQFRLQCVNTALHMAAVALQLGLTGAAGADTTAETRHIHAVSRHAGGGVLQLCQLDLQLTLGANRVQGEDVQNQHGAVDHAQLHAFVLAPDVVLQVADLHGREVAVKDHERDAVPAAELSQLLHLAGADEGAGIGGGLVLHEAREHLAAGGVQEACQLVQADLHLLGIVLTRHHADQNGQGGGGVFLYDNGILRHI